MNNIKDDTKKKNNIKQYIKERKTNQKFICKELGIKESQLSHYIHNRRNPSQEILKSLGKILRTPINKLYPEARKIVYWKL